MRCTADENWIIVILPPRTHGGQVPPYAATWRLGRFGCTSVKIRLRKRNRAARAAVGGPRRSTKGGHRGALGMAHDCTNRIHRPGAAAVQARRSGVAIGAAV